MTTASSPFPSFFGESTVNDCAKNTVTLQLDALLGLVYDALVLGVEEDDGEDGDRRRDAAEDEHRQRVIGHDRLVVRIVEVLRN